MDIEPTQFTLVARKDDIAQVKSKHQSFPDLGILRFGNPKMSRKPRQPLVSDQAKVDLAGPEYPVDDRIKIFLLKLSTDMIVEKALWRMPIRFEPLKEPNTVPLPTVSKTELMAGGNDAKFRSFIHNFLAFSARVDQCRTGFGKRLGISGIAYTTMISIAHLQDEEGVGVSRIAEHLHLSGAFVTIEVSKLVKADLVRKRVNKTDRRRVLLTVTPKGRKLLDGLVVLQAPVNDALFECLSAEEFLHLSSMMERLVPCGDKAISLVEFATKSLKLTAAQSSRRPAQPAPKARRRP